MSQFPPCSGRPGGELDIVLGSFEGLENVVGIRTWGRKSLPGIVRAPSRPTFSLISSLAEPAWTFWAFGG